MQHRQRGYSVTRACHQSAFTRKRVPGYTRPFSPAPSAIFFKYVFVLGKKFHSEQAKMFFVYLESLIDDTP